jgi:hypothetical protein
MSGLNQNRRIKSAYLIGHEALYGLSYADPRAFLDRAANFPVADYFLRGLKTPHPESAPDKLPIQRPLNRKRTIASSFLAGRMRALPRMPSEDRKHSRSVA